MRRSRMLKGAFSKLSLVKKRDLAAAALLSVMFLGQWAWLHEMFKGHPIDTPISYWGDAHFTAAAVTAAKRGEYLPFFSKEIPSLGAPSVANWGDFPGNEDMLIFLVGTLARVTGVFAAINIGYGFAGLAAALMLFFVARRFHLGRPGAVLAGHLYGLSTFMGMRTVHHYTLTFYFFFPAVVLVAAWLNSRKGIALKSNRMKAALAVVVTASWSMIYFVYFAAQVLGIAVLTSVAKFGLSRWRVWLTLGAVGFACVLSMQLDTLLFWRANGPNQTTIQRDARDVENFALKPLNFLAPALSASHDQYRAKLAENAQRESLTRGEAPGPYFGVIGCIAGLGLVATLLTQIGRGKIRFTGSWGLMAWALTGLNSVGGLSSVLGLFGMSLFRSVNRASIVILTYVLLFLAWGFTRVMRKVPMPVRWALVIPLGLLGAYEQSGMEFGARDANRRDLYNSDKALVAEAESKLTPGAHVFELPAIDFPEAYGNGLDTYEMFRPYFYAEKLVFSHGDMKGRPAAQFKQDVAKKPLPEMFATLRQNGFEAIYINLRPYGGVGVLNQFQQAGATVVAVSQMQDSAFIRLP